MNLPMFFCNTHHEDHLTRAQPDYANCAIQVKEFEFDPNEVPHRMQIELTATCRGNGTIHGVNVTLYALPGQLPVDHKDDDLASLILRGVISQSVPIQRWTNQTIECSPDARPGWKPNRPVEWGMSSDPRKGYIIVATLDIPEHPGKPRVQPTHLNPAHDVLVAVYCSKHAERVGSKRCC
jgi:hypothetical protein